MLIQIETASPPFKVSQSKAADELKKRMGGRPAIARMIDMASVHSGIDNRFFVIPDGEENEKQKFYSDDGNYVKPGTRMRMEEYEKWAKKLAKQASKNIFEDNQIQPSQIDKLITISCTGFFAPGLDYYLISELNIPLSVKRTNIGFMGCAASLIGFNSVWESMNSNYGSQNTLLVSVELCSLHLQTEPTRDNILANMIFADGCAAALFTRKKVGSENVNLGIVATRSVLFQNSAEYMGWKIGNYGFEMILSSDLPRIILNEAVPKLKILLSEIGLGISDIKNWALHPGGRAILDSLQKGLQLSEEQMYESRTVLKNYGNMSSASILFVLKEVISSGKIKKDDYCCAVAFGPGLTMEVALFKGV